MVTKPFASTAVTSITSGLAYRPRCAKEIVTTVPMTPENV